ncbi:MAG: sialidase family protein [Victivallales bacterium]
MKTKQSLSGKILADVYTGGKDGYAIYRIPSLLVTRAGTLLAFCEGRVDNGGDHGTIHMLVKRSEDNGRTWSKQTVIYEDGTNTCGNPCPVLDTATGTIWLAMNWNKPGKDSYEFFHDYDGRHALMTSSNDDGRTWTKPNDITADVKRRSWGWHGAGPGVGIQLKRGPHAGRLLIPCCYSEAAGADVCLGANVIYSDAHGQSWHLGGATASAGLNECQIVELGDGRIMLNGRTNISDKPWRRIAFSSDAGLSWSDVKEDRQLPDLQCQGSITSSSDGRLFFSNPIGIPAQAKAPVPAKEVPLEDLYIQSTPRRFRMTVRMSMDEGATWPVSHCLHEGPSCYSCLALLPDGRIACLFERGSKHPYEMITFAVLGF